MFSASRVQLDTTRNYIAVEEKFFDFVLVYELGCIELHGSASFVKRIDPFSAINRHDCQFHNLTVIRSAHNVNRHSEFLCVVQIHRNIAVHNRKVKSRGINLIYRAPSRT